MTNDELNKLIERFQDEEYAISISELHQMACGLIERQVELKDRFNKVVSQLKARSLFSPKTDFVEKWFEFMVHELSDLNIQWKFESKIRCDDLKNKHDRLIDQKKELQERISMKQEFIDALFCIVDELVDAVSILQNRNHKLIEIIKMQKEALEFYADLKSYYVNGAWDFRNHIDNSDLEMVLIYGDYINVGGKKAREALDKLKKEIEA